MIIELSVPSEFVGEYDKDKFCESLSRCIGDIEHQIIHSGCIGAAGNYELETLYMLCAALADSCVVDRECI